MNSIEPTYQQALDKYQRDIASKATGGLIPADPSDIKAFQQLHYKQWADAIRAWARGESQCTSK